MQCYLTHECCQCKSKIFMGVRASPAVISMRTLQKYFSHPSLVVYFFATPTHKTESGTANIWGSTNSKPPGPIIMMGQSETLSSCHIIFITLFSVGVQCYCTFYQPLQAVKLYWAKTIFLSQTGMFWIFFIQFYRSGSHTERCLRFST